MIKTAPKTTPTIPKTTLEDAADSAIASAKAEEDRTRGRARSRGMSARDVDNYILRHWAETVSPFVKALGDKTRLKMVALLSKREPMDVGALAEAMKIKASTASEHLRLLRDAKIILMEKAGVFTRCFVNRPFVAWRLRDIASRLEGRK